MALDRVKPKSPLPVAVADLTLTKDPAKIWPDPLSCPDFVVRGFAASRADALARLEQLRRFLHGDDLLRDPTEAEQSEALARHFVPRLACISGTMETTLDARGFVGLTPFRGNDPGFHIAEAVHIRGYIRKLDNMEEATAVADASAKERALRARLSGFSPQAAALDAELAELAKAASRHAQRLLDEQAARRLPALRGDLEGLWKDACAAAEALGETPPERPARLG